MSEPKLTPWFVNGERPVRKGVYQQMNGQDRLGYQYWDGVFWHGWAETARAARKDYGIAAHSHQNDPWRGLAHPPKAKP